MEGKRGGDVPNPPPAKRVRRTAPEGFDKKKQTSRIPAPEFISGFNLEPPTKSSCAPPKTLNSSVDLEKIRAAHRSTFAFPDYPKKIAERPLRHRPVVLPSPSKPVTAGKNAVCSSYLDVSVSGGSTSRRISELYALSPFSSPMKPVLLDTIPPQGNPPRPNKSISYAGLAQISRPSPVSSSSSSKKPISILKPLPPPPPPLPFPETSPSKRPSMRSISVLPPVAPKVPARHGKMKTIFTTSVALATDPHTESGTAELLSIFIEQHGHGYVPPDERERIRGLGQSPEKASKKTKAAKYIRGGLADSASLLFRRNDTGLSLWQTGQNMKRLRSVAPDLRLRIVTVLHVVKDAGQHLTNQPPRRAIIRCQDIKDPTGKEVNVLLTTPAVVSRMSKYSDLQEGREVHVWRPWRTLDLSASNVNGMLGVDAGAGLGLSGSVMFCSRFWVTPH